ncbi:MAG: hypothetical protein V4556_01180 [Bacteroidota bacterium]
MSKNILVLFFFCFFTVVVSAQQTFVTVNYEPADTKDKLIISYKYGDKLSWADFQGIPTDTDNTAAITSSGIGYNFKLHRTEDSSSFTFIVNCTFSKTKSWVKEAKNDYVLKHEQNHFDISYINTLLFIKKLRAANFSSTEYRKEITRLYRETANELAIMQNNYDTQTLNGRDKDKQKEWDEKIEKQLKLLQSEVL